MTELTARPDTREQRASTVLLDALPPLPAGASVLVANDRLGQVTAALQDRALSVTRWSRHAQGERPGTPWPEGGPFDAATLRLPRSRPALTMAVHAIAAALKPGAPLWVYGANDEGIKSARNRIGPVMGEVSVLDARKHCRVVEAHAPAEREGIKTTLADFQQTLPLPSGPVGSSPVEHVSYPGVFAKGKLDPGTAALLAALPALPADVRVLDFACGIGVIGGEILRRQPSATVLMTDADAVAVEAARRNVPGALVHCADRWQGIAPQKQLDRIFSNPPIHQGKGRSYEVLNDLIAGAPARMRSKAELWLVVQRQVPVEGPLGEAFVEVKLIAESANYRVWKAMKPRRKKRRRR